MKQILALLVFAMSLLCGCQKEAPKPSKPSLESTSSKEIMDAADEAARKYGSKPGGGK